jgi:hypothetical protein
MEFFFVFEEVSKNKIIIEFKKGYISRMIVRQLKKIEISNC